MACDPRAPQVVKMVYTLGPILMLAGEKLIADLPAFRQLARPVPFVLRRAE